MGNVASQPLVVDRYAIYDRIAAGGMATVHFGRLIGEGGFSRIVAIKRLHAHFALDPDFVTMFLDEARLAARVRHPNVMPTLDVVARGDEVFLVMEYVEGEPLSNLLRASHDRGERVPLGYVGALMVGLLEGLHAAHNAKDDQGFPLHIVHRDISPHNVLVGVDGIPRVIDFGVAKALGQVHTTREGQIRGKLAYMSPEQVLAKAVDARTDIFAASAVLWEAIVGRKLFKADNDAGIMHLLLSAPIDPPSKHVQGLPPGLDAVVMRGLARDPDRRYSSADEMAAALSEVLPGAPFRKVGAWVKEVGGQRLADRASLVRDIERLSASGSGVSARAPEEQSPLSSASGSRSSAALQAGNATYTDRATTAVMPPRLPEEPFVVDPTRGSASVATASPSLLPGAPNRRLLPALVGAAVGVVIVYGIIVAIQSQMVSVPLAPDFPAAAVGDPKPPSTAPPAAPTANTVPTTSAVPASAPLPTSTTPAPTATTAPRAQAPAPTASAAPTSRPSSDDPAPRPRARSTPPPALAPPASSAKIFSRY